MEITIPLPPPLNATYKMGRGHYYKSKEMKEWQEEVGWTIKNHRRSLQKLTGPLFIGITMFLKRDRDWDSSLKGLSDVLEGIVYENDNQIVHANIKKYVDKKNPRMEIVVEQTTL